MRRKWSYLSKITANLLAALLLPINGYAYSTSQLSCPGIVHNDTIPPYQSLTAALGSDVYVPALKIRPLERTGNTSGFPQDPEERLQTIEKLIGLIELDIRTEAIKFVTESLYYIYEPRQLKNSFYRTETKKIASKAAYLMCQSGCKGGMKALKQKSQEVVDELVNDRTPRFTFAELKEQLEINYQGLNSILKFRKDGHPDFYAYQSHYMNLLLDFPGALMRTQIAERNFGAAFTMEDFRWRGGVVTGPKHKTAISDRKFKKALDQHFNNIRSSWARFSHAALFKFHWYDKANLFTFLDMAKGIDHLRFPVPDRIDERALLLFKYMSSAPLAMARVLKQNPEFESELCWIIEEMDHAVATRRMDTAIGGINGYLMPLTIGALIITAPFSSTIFVTGLIALNVMTLIDLAKRSGDNGKLKREIRFHERHLIPNVASQETIDKIHGDYETYRSQQKMIATILVAEVAFALVGLGVAAKARKTISNNTLEENARLLEKPFKSRSSIGPRRGLRSPKEMNNMIARTATRDAIELAKHQNPEHYRKLSSRIFRNRSYSAYDEMAFDLMYLIKYGPKDVVKKLLLKHRGTGLGSRAIQIETSNEIIEQIYVHLNTPAMDDFTVFEIIFDVLAGVQP